MNIDSNARLNTLSNKEAVFFLIQKVLKSSYPLAIWKLPDAPEVYVLIDITKDTSETELEDLSECFIINAYEQSHPPRPLVLKGDIIIRLDENEVDTRFRPALSADKTDAFFKQIDQHEIPRKPIYDNSIHSPDFVEAVKKAIEHIKSGEAQKIVLSRYEDYELHQDFDPLDLFDQLVKNYPNAFCHLTQTKQYGLWIGASPEKLIAIEMDRYFSTDAIAGTQLLGDQTLAEVAWRQKEIEEQAMVSRYIINCLKKIRLREFEEIGPRTVKAGNLAHLKTEFKVDMETTNSPMLGSTMLNLLHPTSAVCGLPGRAANTFLQAHEGYSRELYAGFLGPVGFEGNTRLFVNLRCMKILGTYVRLFAGAGIMEDSDPEKEMAETTYKMQTLLKVLHT